MRIAAREDHCLRGLLRGQQSLRQVSVCKRTQSVCASPHSLSHLEACWKNSERVHVLPCCVDVDRVHGCCKATGLPLFLPQTSLLHEKCRVKPRGRESENVPNRNKTKSQFLFTVFN